MRKTFTLIIICTVVSLSAFCQAKISMADASKHYGETVTICDKVFGIELIQSQKAINTTTSGKNKVSSRLSILLTYENMKKLTENGKSSILNKNVCVTGKVIDYNGQPEILISRPEEIIVLREPGGTSDIKPNDFMKFE